MLTNIVLNDALIEEAFSYTNVSTPQELIELVLREFIANHKRRNIKELRGKIKLMTGYNYKALRGKTSN